MEIVCVTTLYFGPCLGAKLLLSAREHNQRWHNSLQNLINKTVLAQRLWILFGPRIPNITAAQFFTHNCQTNAFQMVKRKRDTKINVADLSLILGYQPTLNIAHNIFSKMFLKWHIILDKLSNRLCFMMLYQLKLVPLGSGRTGLTLILSKEYLLNAININCSYCSWQGELLIDVWIIWSPVYCKSHNFSAFIIYLTSILVSCQIFITFDVNDSRQVELYWIFPTCRSPSNRVKNIASKKKTESTPLYLLQRRPEVWRITFTMTCYLLKVKSWFVDLRWKMPRTDCYAS